MCFFVWCKVSRPIFLVANLVVFSSTAFSPSSFIQNSFVHISKLAHLWSYPLRKNIEGFSGRGSATPATGWLKQGFCSQFSRAKSQQPQHSLRKHVSPHWVIQLRIQTLSKEAGEEGGGSVWTGGRLFLLALPAFVPFFLPKIRGGAGPGPEPSPRATPAHAIVNR